MREGIEEGTGDGRLNSYPQFATDELHPLCVYDSDEPLGHVEQTLLDWGMSTKRVRNCAEAIAALGNLAPPSLVLTDASLPDGTWLDVLRIAGSLPTGGVPVIVVSPFVDIHLYLEVLENGGHDFVVPPVTHAEMAHIIGTAILKGQFHNSGERHRSPANASESG